MGKHGPLHLHFVLSTAKHVQGDVKSCSFLCSDMRRPMISYKENPKANLRNLQHLITCGEKHLQLTHQFQH
jgi:hypothetical protein